MNRTMISAFAVLAFIVVAAMVLRPQYHSIKLSAAAMPSLQELHAMAGVHELPDQDIDDQSLVFSAKTKE